MGDLLNNGVHLSRGCGLVVDALLNYSDLYATTLFVLPKVYVSLRLSLFINTSTAWYEVLKLSIISRIYVFAYFASISVGSTPVIRQ
jgi:hypothetical protein